MGDADTQQAAGKIYEHVCELAGPAGDEELMDLVGHGIDQTRDGRRRLSQGLFQHIATAQAMKPNTANTVK